MWIVDYENLAMELNVASNTWMMGFLSLSVLHFTSWFSFHDNSFSVSVSQVLSFHLILEASRWAPAQPRPSPGQTSLLTAECVSWLLETSCSISYSSFNLTSPSLNWSSFLPDLLLIFDSLFQEWHLSPPNHHGWKLGVILGPSPTLTPISIRCHIPHAWPLLG